MLKNLLTEAATKLLSILVSVKVHIIILATVLLYHTKITGDNWTTLIISIAAARVGIGLLGIWKDKDVEK